MPPPHGTASRYSNNECRCDACRIAATRQNADNRRARYGLRYEVNGTLIAPVGQHGTASTYQNHGCRCTSCRAAQSIANRHQRRRG